MTDDQPKTFVLPVSDCACFIAGELNDAPKPEMPPGEEAPRFGVIIWYKSKEVARVACIAAIDAHSLGKTNMSDDHFKAPYHDIIEAFDKDPTAIQFLREDGDGGFSSGVYRMAREIERLRKKCGEPSERDPSWEQKEDEEIDAEIEAELANTHHQ